MQTRSWRQSLKVNIKADNKSDDDIPDFISSSVARRGSGPELFLCHSKKTPNEVGRVLDDADIDTLCTWMP